MRQVDAAVERPRAGRCTANAERRRRRMADEEATEGSHAPQPKRQGRVAQRPRPAASSPPQALARRPSSLFRRRPTGFTAPKVSRRRVLQIGFWAGLLALLGAIGATILNSFYPRGVTGFGAQIVVGTVDSARAAAASSETSTRRRGSCGSAPDAGAARRGARRRRSSRSTTSARTWAARCRGGRSSPSRIRATQRDVPGLVPLPVPRIDVQRHRRARLRPGAALDGHVRAHDRRRQHHRRHRQRSHRARPTTRRARSCRRAARKRRDWMNTSKQINIMVGLIFVSLIATGAYWMWDPDRARRRRRTRQLETTIERGAFLFSQNCRDLPRRLRAKVAQRQQPPARGAGAQPPRPAGS